MADLKIVVHGALGKMGQEVLGTVCKTEGMTPHGAADIAGPEGLTDLPDGSGEIPISSDISKVAKGADVIVDFTNAEGARNVISAASKNGVNCVIGSTGLLSGDFETAERVATESNISIIIAPNFAMGGVLMTYLVEAAAKFFDYADLTEVHHEAKLDAPSGTALSIAEAVASGKGKDFKAVKAEKETLAGTRGGTVHGISIHSGRLPGRVAHHELVFGSSGQTLTIRHDSINRESFMPGVIMAIKHVLGQPKLIWGLEKVMGL